MIKTLNSLKKGSGVHTTGIKFSIKNVPRNIGKVNNIKHLSRIQLSEARNW